MLGEGAPLGVCPLCNSPTAKALTPPRTRRDSWPDEGITLEHIADKPMHFERKSQLKAYCKEKGLSSGALL